MTFFDNAIRALDTLGVQDVVLPFLLIFTVSYVVIRNIPMFNKKSIAMTLSLAISLAVIFPHVTGGNYSYYGFNADVVDIINNSMPYIGLALIVVFSMLILLSIFGIQFTEYANTAYGGMLAITCLLIVGYIFGSSAGWFNTSMFYWLNQDTQALIVMVAIFVLMIMFITSEDKGDDKPFHKWFPEMMSNFFKKMESPKEKK